MRDADVRRICENAGIKLVTFIPEKFVSKDEVREYLRNQIIAFYDTDKSYFDEVIT